MTLRIGFALALAGVVALAYFASVPAQACCPAPRPGQAVLNADQTVIMVWDAATKTQHFIRQASFKSAADDFGFLIPTPAQPELEESGNEAFAFLRKLTEPEIKRVPGPSRRVGCGCSDNSDRSTKKSAEWVRVLDEKLVAGFDAVVLEASSPDALATWLKEHGYAYSPEVAAWAKPYIQASWKITALKVAKVRDGEDKKTVNASALRLSFKTDRPLFPYREPDSKKFAQDLEAKRRLLRIYFVAEARYQGELTREQPWTGRVEWAGKLKKEDRLKALGLLKLPETTGPAEWWLTEFEDPWPYQVAPADVYFSRSATQKALKREPVVEYVSASWPNDGMVYALAMALVFLPLLTRVRRAWK